MTTHLSAVAGRFVRFAMVGGATTLFYGVLAWALVEHASIAPVPASVLAYVASVPLNFLLQRGFAFRSENRVQRDLPRYLLVHAGNIAASAAVMHVVVSVLHAAYLWGVVATMTFVPVVVFFLLDRWVFKRLPG
ncbi:GtrA family protein [Lysobacter sp. 2RAF19]